jgi:hypothetical protein
MQTRGRIALIADERVVRARMMAVPVITVSAPAAPLAIIRQPNSVPNFIAAIRSM